MMRGILTHALGRLGWSGKGSAQAKVAEADAARCHPLPRMIPGGQAARELCMLARTEYWPNAPLADLLHEKRLVQAKMDGIRCLYIDGQVVTREGVPMACATHCLPALQRLEASYGMPMMFDGEFVEEDGFEATLSAFRKGEGAGVLWLFDAVPLHHWQGGRCVLPIEARLADLRYAILQADSPFVGYLDHWIMDGAETAAKARELWNHGYEGLVSKRLGSFYERKRSDAWVKLKLVHTSRAVVVDMDRTKPGKLPWMLVRCANGRTIKVATGWNAKEQCELVAGYDAGDRVEVEVRYELSVGVKPSVRSAAMTRILGISAHTEEV